MLLLHDPKVVEDGLVVILQLCELDVRRVVRNEAAVAIVCRLLARRHPRASHGQLHRGQRRFGVGYQKL